MRRARGKDWGLYTNTRMEKGRVAMKEGRSKVALRLFLEVNYLDLNGPENSGLPWDPSMGMLAPAVVEWTWEVGQACGLGLAELEPLFLEIAQKQRANLKLPVTPNDAWLKLKAALEGRVAELEAKEMERAARQKEREAAREAKKTETAAAKASEREAKAVAKKAAKVIQTSQLEVEDGLSGSQASNSTISKNLAR